VSYIFSNNVHNHAQDDAKTTALAEASEQQYDIDKKRPMLQL